MKGNTAAQQLLCGNNLPLINPHGEKLVSANSEEQIFQKAIGLPEQLRDGFVEQACGSDSDLQRRVRDLIAAHRQPDSFLDGRVAETQALPGLGQEVIGQFIGPYRILQELGEGLLNSRHNPATSGRMAVHCIK